VNVDFRQRTSESFGRIVELPMLVLALLMVPLLLAPELVNLSDSVKSSFTMMEWLIWSIFAFELVIKTYLSADRPRYLRQHWFDVLIVVVPFLRPLRVARSMRLLRAMRGTRLLSVAMRMTYSSRMLLQSSGVKYAVLAGGLLFLASATLAFVFEKAGNGNITNFGEAVWWAAATISTVGYGDYFPVTTEGRAIAIFLMFLGFSLFSVITASVAAFFVRPDQERDEATLEDVLRRLESLEQLLLSLHPDVATPAHAEGNGASVLVTAESRESETT
jgi:voltage-gated potassium channel